MHVCLREDMNFISQRTLLLYANFCSPLHFYFTCQNEILPWHILNSVATLHFFFLFSVFFYQINMQHPLILRWFFWTKLMGIMQTSKLQTSDHLRFFRSGKLPVSFYCLCLSVGFWVLYTNELYTLKGQHNIWLV